MKNGKRLRLGNRQKHLLAKAKRVVKKFLEKPRSKNLCTSAKVKNHCTPAYNYIRTYGGRKHTLRPCSFFKKRGESCRSFGKFHTLNNQYIEGCGVSTAKPRKSKVVPARKNPIVHRPKTLQKMALKKAADEMSKNFLRAAGRKRRNKHWTGKGWFGKVLERTKARQLKRLKEKAEGAILQAKVQQVIKAGKPLFQIHK